MYSEFYFGVENLCKDMFLRQSMDEDGYVPAILLASFNRVIMITGIIDPVAVLNAARESILLDVDEENEKLRMKSGWEKWLLPNAQGGMGAPRYIKQKAVVVDVKSSKLSTAAPPFVPSWSTKVDSSEAQK